MKRKIGGLIIAIMLVPVFCSAQMTLESVVKQAISSNPKVLESWDSFQESIQERKAAKGGYLPTVDLKARAGHQVNTYDDNDETFDPAYATFSLRQLLFDGMGTPNEVSQLGHNTLAKYYEMLQTSEDIAFEAVEAYADVVRFRELLKLANENYQAHKRIYDQVNQRVESGVGRGVDLEQAKGRLALAQSNQITEANNLHDVTARFYRIVGELPLKELAALPATSSIAVPEASKAALEMSIRSNPGFMASIEKVHAAEKVRDARKASYMPKIDFLATYDIGSDRDEIDGHSEESFVGVELSFNLYRGGSDVATVRALSERVERAIKLREISCRNLRQTVAISHTALKMIESQLASLLQHAESTAKARIAYLDQFEIGQRSLLDLLDSENEHFRASRAYSIAKQDYFIAHAETLANMGDLLTTFDIRQESPSEVDELNEENDPVSPQQYCPVEDISQELYSVTAF
ncbi:MAG: TolC family outer membrane protein [Desulfuromonadales bacterium]|nr:TolC family outer membrane protein [Desulfuromonadales bacterium]